MPTSALIIAVEQTAIPGFDDRVGLIRGAEDFVRWLVDPAGGGLDRSRVWMACAPAPDLDTGSTADYEPPHDLVGVNTAGRPTVSELEAVADDIAAGQQRGELVVYWAGHGMVDLPNESLQTLALSDNSRVTLRSLLMSLVERIGSDGTVAVIDACRKLGLGFGFSSGNLVQMAKGGPGTQLPEKLAVFYACSENEAAYTAEDGRGRFTAAVLESLHERDARPDAGSWLSAQEIAWLRDRLQAELERLGQRPTNLLKGWSESEIIARSPAIETFAPDEWAELLRLADSCDGRIERRFVQRTYTDALPAGADPVPPGTVRLRDYLVHTAMLGRSSNSAPPNALVFLYALTWRPPQSPQESALKEWLGQDMNWWNWRDVLKNSYYATQVALADRSNEGFYLVVRIKPGERLSRDDRKSSAKRYLYRAGLFQRDKLSRDRFWWVTPDEDAPRSLDEIEKLLIKQVDGIRATKEIHFAGEPAGADSITLSGDELSGLTVEFIVPRMLLGYPFAGWRLVTGFQLGDKHAVVVRDGDRWWDREPEAEATRDEIRLHAKKVTNGGAQLAVDTTEWVTCDQVDEPNLRAGVPAAPYVAFAFPAVNEISINSFRYRPTKPLAAALKMGAVAMLWPVVEQCPVRHEVVRPDQANAACSSVFLRADYEGAINTPERDLRPRFFVRDLRNEPYRQLGQLTLFYDDGTRTLEGNPFGAPGEH